LTAYNVIDRTSLVSGQPEDVSVVLSNFDLIAAVLNGGLDNANVNAAAARAASKLAAGAGGQLIGGAGPGYIYPPGYEALYFSNAANYGPTAISSGGNGDALANLGPVTTENVRYYAELSCRLLCTGANGFPALRLHEGNAGAVGALVVEAFSYCPAGLSTSVFFRFPFTPAAGTREYHLRWRDAGASGNVTMQNITFPVVVRIVKA
jgi:hypothetical protein